MPATTVADRGVAAWKGGKWSCGAVRPEPGSHFRTVDREVGVNS